MFKPTALTTFLLTLLLTACGGDGGGSVVGSSGSSDGDTTTVGTGDNVTTGTDIGKPRLGTGSRAQALLLVFGYQRHNAERWWYNQYFRDYC